MILDNNNPQIEAVLNLFNETLTKVVPTLSHRSIQANIIISLHQFKNSIRWKKVWVKNRTVDMENSISDEEEEEFDKEGLGNQLIPKYKGAHKGYDRLEHLLDKLEIYLL